MGDLVQATAPAKQVQEIVAEALPPGWWISRTETGEILVSAPNADPGGMTIPAGEGGNLPLRLLRALARDLLEGAPQCAGKNEEAARTVEFTPDRVQQAARNLGKWLNEEVDRPVSREDLAMLVHHANSTLGPRHLDDAAADQFIAEVKRKLAASRAKGREGWQEAGPHELAAQLRAQIDKGDPLDAAIYAMFMWHLGFRIEPAPRAPMVWPQARDVGRLDDMHETGHLRVGLDSDNDVYISVFDGASVAGLEFCNPGGGGGGASPRTRQALIALMVAMEADNAARPDRDWWALRNANRKNAPTNDSTEKDLAK